MHIPVIPIILAFLAVTGDVDVDVSKNEDCSDPVTVTATSGILNVVVVFENGAYHHEVNGDTVVCAEVTEEITLSFSPVGSQVEGLRQIVGSTSKATPLSAYSVMFTPTEDSGGDVWEVETATSPTTPHISMRLGFHDDGQ